MYETVAYIGADKFTVDDIVARVKVYLAQAGIDGFTAQEGRGFWKGTSEPVVIITVFAQPTQRASVEAALLKVAKLAGQEAVAFKCGGTPHLVEVK